MPMAPSMSPYTPRIYGPGGRGRFRSYPHVTRTSIPGAGFRVRKLVWGEQPLNLGGARAGVPLTRYGDYAEAPLLGLGVAASTITGAVDVAARLINDPEGTLRSRGPLLVSSFDRHVLTPGMDVFAKRSAPYMIKYLLPPLAVLYVITGLGAFWSFKAARKLNANRPRKRRRK